MSLLPMPALKAQEVHLWTLTPDRGNAAAYTSLLSPAEADRARRFRFPELTESFVADHGRLRLLLGSYLDIPPHQLEFVENAHGKPRISTPGCGLHFNLTHTRGLTMIGVCLDAELGIDVEALRPIEDRDDIAAFNFSARENAALQKQPESERDAAFLRCWTRKEAYIKARGEGMSLPLGQFTVSLSPHDPPALLHCEWDEQEPDRWTLENLLPLDGYVGALALKRGPWSVINYKWPPENLPVEGAGETV